MLDSIRRSYDGKSGAGIARFSRADLLVLDDLGKENANSWVLTTLFQILNERYERLLPTVFTSQYAICDLERRMSRNGERESAQAIASRIGQVSTVVDLGRADRRAAGDRILSSKGLAGSNGPASAPPSAIAEKIEERIFDGREREGAGRMGGTSRDAEPKIHESRRRDRGRARRQVPGERLAHARRVSLARRPLSREYPYEFAKAGSVEELRVFFAHGNWAIRQGIV